MTLAFPYFVLVASLLGLVFSLKGFSFKQIALLILWGGILLIILQYVYFSIGRGFDVNLFFIKGNLEVNNFTKNIENYNNSVWGVGIFWLFFALLAPAALEEFWKFFIFKKISKQLHIVKSVNTSIFAIIYVAIGFSFFETGSYMFFLRTSLTHVELFRLEITRILISTLSHIFFSAIVGYYFWKALFLKFELIDTLEISKTIKIIKKFSFIPYINITSVSKIYVYKYILTGFSLSVFFHTIYNFFMSTWNELFAVVTVLIGIGIFLRLITIKKYNANYSELKKKISHLQEIKLLKEALRAKQGAISKDTRNDIKNWHIKNNMM